MTQMKMKKRIFLDEVGIYRQSYHTRGNPYKDNILYRKGGNSGWCRIQTARANIIQTTQWSTGRGQGRLEAAASSDKWHGSL